jgi:tetratricopeptide (TPR) repeat protein
MNVLPLLLPLVVAIALSAQVDPRSALLERDAWAALNAGNTHAAAEAFRDAIVADPKNARNHLGAATAAFLERRYDDAMAALEQALTLDSRLAAARALLGQVQHRMGRLPDAIRTFEALVADAPGDRDAAGTLDRWRREAGLHDRMQQAVGHHFTVSFDGPAEAALAEEALHSLDRAYWRIGELLGSYPNEPVPVVLYTAEQFSDITRSPAWAAGAYDGTIRVPMRGALDNPAELDRVLAHEFAHALVYTLAPQFVPAWLNEGLASALETDSLAWARKQVEQATGPLPLRTLESGFGRLSGDQARLAYATSALIVGRMLEEDGGFAVANLLRDIGAGVPFDAAFLRRFQRSFEDFQSARD